MDVCIHGESSNLDKGKRKETESGSLVFSKKRYSLIVYSLFQV